MGFYRYLCFCCLFKKPKFKKQEDLPLLDPVAGSSRSSTPLTEAPLETSPTKKEKIPPVKHYEFDLIISDPDEPLIERTCRISTKNFARPYILTLIREELPTDATITHIKTTYDYDIFDVFYEHNQIAYKQNFDINSQQILIYDPCPASSRRNSI